MKKGQREDGYWVKEKLGKRIICKNTKWKKRNQQEQKLGKKEIGKKQMWGKGKIRKIEILETGKRKITYNKGGQ